MSFVVIDTNVLMVANEDFPPGQADVDCVTACIERLEAIQNGSTKERVVLDDDDRILGEYEETLRGSRQPSTGHAFLHWLFQAGWDQSLCERVTISCRNEFEQLFEEFPVHAALSDFDVADRKFVAAANAHAAKPPILQAVDAKWIAWEPALNECGIQIEWLCPVTAKQLYRKHRSGV
jgi:hypothetical protein